MTTLVVGASGATGRLVVEQLLDRGQTVRAMLRRPESLPDTLRARGGLALIPGAILDFDLPALTEHVRGCDAIVSCLGHTLTLKGIYGKPRRLVTEAVSRLCDTVVSMRPGRPVRFVLMNTAGNSNRDLDEPRSFAERCVLALLRRALPPHVDNEAASDVLRVSVGPNHPSVEWVVLRPDTLVNTETVTPYTLHTSPTSSALFHPGRTSRINTAHCLAAFTDDDKLWNTWKGGMPVIYGA